MVLPLMSLFTLEDSVLIFQLLNYQLTHLPILVSASPVSIANENRILVTDGTTTWLLLFKLSITNYGNYQFSHPPLFVSKNLQKTNISARSLPVATSCESLSPPRAPQLFPWNHADKGDMVTEHAF